MTVTATFVLGLGAQKGGTTWLHRYLAQQDGFVRGAMKEYHVWDAIYRTDAEAPVLEGADTGEREALRRKLIEEPDFYFDHFASLLNGGAIAADITPAYSALPAEALERIVDGFRQRGIRTKTVFLMRDPVERCWSAVRMYRRKGLKVAGLDPSLDERSYLGAYAATSHAARRGRYERTIEAIEAAFPATDSHFGLYETLFQPEEVGRLSSFLGVAAKPGLIADEYNVSPKRRSLPVKLRQAIARTYAPTLSFCADRFPEIRSLWESYDLAAT